MLAVHGFWSLRLGLCLWAENSEHPVSSASRATRRARPHPFAASADRLAEHHGGKPATATLLLPSTATSPLDSAELVRTTPRRASSRPPGLLAWTVPVASFTAPEARSVLDQRVDDVRFGASVSHLADVVAFAGELTERGRVLPELIDAPDGYLARWRPVIQGPDVAAVHTLTAAMPPVCRAETNDPAVTRGHDPAVLLHDALGALVDASVRERLAATGSSLLDPLATRWGRRPRRTPVVETWLDALTNADGGFTADPDDAARLMRELARWADVGTGQSGPARATFRLTEASQSGPTLFDQTDDGGATASEAAGAQAAQSGAADDLPSDDPDNVGAGADGQRWRLDFFLQSVDDPSLLVPADQVWDGGDDLHRWLDRADQLLLGELGRASTVYPELSGALRRARPSALELDAEGAYSFLSTKAGVLAQAGFGVLLPSWWTKPRRVGLRASAHTPTDGVVSSGQLGRGQLVEFEWQLAVGDDPLTADELAALAAAKAPLVKLRGEWVAVDPDQLRRGLEFLTRQPAEPQHRTVAEVLALAAGDPDAVDVSLPVTSVQADGWVGDLLSGVAERTLERVAPPEEFRAELRPYQERGLSWLAFLSGLGLGACLADDMGLGKTVQLLALESLQRTQDPEMEPTLLICPMSLVGNWQREAARFAPSLTVYAHHGAGRPRGTELDARLAAADLVVTTYHTAVRDAEDLHGRRWARIVLDEAQAIKNSRSRAAVVVRQFQSHQRVALTGTPMENRLSELWSVMDFLNPGVLGSAEQFRSRYAVPVERYGQTEPAERLRAITRPYILRRLKTDPDIIDDLPEKLEIKQYYQLTSEQASLYQAVVDEMMDKIENTDGIERRGNVLATMAKLKQVCNHPAQLLHDHSDVGRRSGKVIRLEEVLDEILAEGDRVLCFTQYTEFAELLLPHLSARFQQDVLYLHGGTPKKRRDEMVERFQSGDGPAIFLLSLKAGGTGLNLTAANHVLHLDRWWNPAVENQATDRAFRIGQKRNVQVRKFVCVGTLEEKIDDMIEEKKALAQMVVSDGERWLTELSTNALRDVFALSGEAVGE